MRALAKISRQLRIAGLGVLLGIVAPAVAEFAIPWHTIDGGGGMNSSGGSFTLSGTIGQPDASQTVMSGGGFTLTGGFWAGVSADTACPGDTNGDNLVDNTDLQAILEGWASSTGDPTYDPDADFDQDGTISNFDLQQVLDNWAQSCG
jgi:hypothetical protein